MTEKVDLAAKLAPVDQPFQPNEGAEILLTEPVGTPNTGDSGVEAATEEAI
jgi:hypothetical protein